MNRVVLLLLLLAGCTHAPKTAGTSELEGLTELQFDRFNTSYNIFYSPENTAIINQPYDEFILNEPRFRDYNIDCESGAFIVMTTVVSGSEYLVYLGACPDYEFCFQQIGHKANFDFSISANTMYVPGNNQLYSAGFLNENFTKRRQFEVVDGRLNEVAQPFYYVGLKSNALRPIAVYEDKTLTKASATIPAQGEIEVLLCDSAVADLYLVKTKFGVVGWASIQAGQYESIEVEGISFSGD